MTAQELIYFFLGVSAFSPILAAFFVRQVIGFDTELRTRNGRHPQRTGKYRRVYEEQSVFAALGATGRRDGCVGTAGQRARLLPRPLQAAGGEANLKLPDLTQVQFLGMNGHAC